MKRKIVITGANGYVASHLISELLARDYEIAALVREEHGLNGYVIRLSQVVGNNETGVTRTDYGILQNARVFY